MDDTQSVLKWSLLAGAGYFLLVAGAHLLGIKTPFLYVYYDLPSNAYQDKIISFTSFGWAMFFVAGYSSVKRGSLRSVRYIVMAAAGAVGGLCLINLCTDFRDYSPKAQVPVYWLETFVLGVFLGWLAFLYTLTKQTAGQSKTYLAPPPSSQ